MRPDRVELSLQTRALGAVTASDTGLARRITGALSSFGLRRTWTGRDERDSGTTGLRGPPGRAGVDEHPVTKVSTSGIIAMTLAALRVNLLKVKAVFPSSLSSFRASSAVTGTTRPFGVMIFLFIHTGWFQPQL